MEEVRVLVPTAMLGYGFPVEHFRSGLAYGPHLIAVDSGSTDSGPHKLGLGSMTCSRQAYVKDIGHLLDAAHEAGVPLAISSAGGAGTDAQVDAFVDIVRHICAQRGYRFRVCAIYSEIPKEEVKRALREGRISPCGPVPQLTEEEIEASTSIVAQMGAEPFVRALEEGAQVIIAGRSYDPAPAAALCLKEGFDPGLSWHMAKIVECGALCAVPASKPIIAFVRRDHFELEPLDPMSRCTDFSVAAHTLYEKSHPYLLPGPGGVLDVSGCSFVQASERRVRVFGSRFVPSDRYCVKLEGAKRVGYRAIFVAGIRDPFAIREIDSLLREVEEDVRSYFSEIDPSTYRMVFHVYGRDGVMGEFEPQREITSHELCVILEVAARTQEEALAICSRARTELLHHPYRGRIATAGNIALPFTPLEIPLGEVCAFNVYHLMEIDDPVKPFRMEFFEV